MSREVKTEILINTTKENLWKVLVSFDDYPSWNPFVKSIQGKPELGAKIAVSLQFANGDKMNFKPKITSMDENKRFSWLGKAFFKVLFEGEHIFEIERISNSECKLIQKEAFSGLLVPLMWKKLKVNATDSFNIGNKAIKAQCEVN